MTWDDIKHFESEEFDSPDAPGSGATGMELDFVRKLDLLRETVGIPLAIHSGYRTPQHNAEVGGVDSSAHESGVAADIACSDSRQRFEIVKAALTMGFRRLGIAKTFVHIDADITKDQDVIWLYS